ncbi:unnamed protein product [Brachionus calyciflorus]|uniref:Uncharacterized protein n=1 Tax=Brachionus calyciflorus TaxID=104777 RepID=A0A813PLH8_9BILA|nr:unnamed protein product [Brachionus calyciflorus]
MDTMETTESLVYDQTDVVHTPINTPSKLNHVKENVSKLKKRALMDDDGEDVVDEDTRKSKVIIDDLIDIAEGFQSDNFLLSISFKKVVERIGTECDTKIKELSDKVCLLEKGPTLQITSNQHNQLSWVDALTKPSALSLPKELIDLNLNEKQRLIQHELRKKRKENNEKAAANGDQIRYGIRGSFLVPFKIKPAGPANSNEGPRPCQTHEPSHNNYQDFRPPASCRLEQNFNEQFSIRPSRVDIALDKFTLSLNKPLNLLKKNDVNEKGYKLDENIRKIKCYYTNPTSLSTNVLDYVINDSSFRINELEIGPQLGMSEQDHLSIIFDYLCTVKFSENKEQNRTKKFNYTKTNIRESIEYFSKAMRWQENFVPKKKPSQKKELSGLMNSDVRNMINEKYKAWKRYSTEACSEAKIHYEKKVISSIGKKPKIIYDYKNKLNVPKSTIKSIRINNVLESDSLKVADCLNNYFSSIFNSVDDENLPIFDSCTDLTFDLNLEESFSPAELKHRLERLDEGKPNGPDDVKFSNKWHAA